MDFILAEMKSQYEIKNRGRFGNGPTDVHAIEVLVRTRRLWEADARHMNMIMDHFGLIEVYLQELDEEWLQGGSVHGERV